MSESVKVFMQSFTIINIKDRTSGLDEIYFPSLTICNINPLRKSFIYWLQDELNENGQTDVAFEDLLNIIGKFYYSTADGDEITERDTQIMDEILGSKGFKEKFEEFMRDHINGSDIVISPKSNKIFVYNEVEDADWTLGVYNEVTKKTYHKNFLRELASQWKKGQMIPYIMWDGMDPDDHLNMPGGVFLQLGYGTSYGLCNFITPYFRHMPTNSNQIILNYLAKGALNGENNGLSILVDAETFDYGNGFADIGQRSGVGFKVAVLHHLDTAVMESNGLKINVGKEEI